jgi:hypothetical protein
LQTTWDRIYGHEGNNPPYGAERDRLHERYDELHQLTLQFDAARGRRTWKNTLGGEWPPFL